VTSPKKKAIMEKRARKESGHFFTSILRIFFWFGFVGLFAGAAFLVGLFFYLSEDLPSIQTLDDYRPPVITSIYSDDGRKIAEFFKERRIVAPLSAIPDSVKKAFVAAEDSRFYFHRGVDFLGIARAFFRNIEAGTIVQGGSTITQQVTKSFLLTPERKYTRKIKEAILAYRIEKRFSKDEILYLYLNQIYLGGGAYGVAAAAENYFNKPVGNLTLAESAILAGLPQAPSRYSPFRYPDRAKQRQLYVLSRMVEQGDITQAQADAAGKEPLTYQPPTNLYLETVPYYSEYIRQYVENKYGQEALYTGGLQIYSAVNIEMQEAAGKEIEQGLRDLDKRQGYRGPVSHLAKEQFDDFLKEGGSVFKEGEIRKGLVEAVDNHSGTVSVRVGEEQGKINLEDMKWARKPNPNVSENSAPIRRVGDALKIGDVILVKKTADKDKDSVRMYQLEQTPQVQGALVCIDAPTGQVKAMVGGRDFKENQFNRAVQSKRQPGSAFKPIIYAAALDKGYTPATIIIDSPVVYRDASRNFTWKPKNYERTFNGPTPLRTALTKSLNLITIKILEDIGVDYAIGYARKLGITSEIERNLSIALGSSGVSLLELTQAYSVFDNLGYYHPPIFITRILDRNGREIESAASMKEKVLDAGTAYIMTSMLESVVKEGTGQRVQALGRPVAGKTGTTNDLYDAWFIGYTPEYVTGAWVGFDDESSLGRGETGAKAASPIWLGFMKRILEDKPIQGFQVPSGVVFTKIDEDTGLLPNAHSTNVVYECFKEGTAPTEYSHRPDTVTEVGDFYKEGI
jgi:penicillin-binding protein 1A